MEILARKANRIYVKDVKWREILKKEQLLSKYKGGNSYERYRNQTSG